MSGRSWGVARRKWLGDQRFERLAQQQAFDSYLHAVELLDARIALLEAQIRELADAGPQTTAGRAAALFARDRHR